MSLFKCNFLIVSIVVLAQAQFPLDPKPCKYGDGECILKIINFLIREKSEGDSSLNLIRIDPLHVPKLSVRQGAQSAVNINLTFIDNDIVGISKVNAYKVKGFEKDFETRHEIRVRTGVVSFIGDYIINGKVLILPIIGKGKNNMTLLNCDFIATFMGKSYEKDGRKYMKIYDLKVIAKPERIYYNFTNLFNGDKSLGDAMNTFLNENWRAVYAEVESTVQKAFINIFKVIINNVFSKYPYEQFFVE